MTLTELLKAGRLREHSTLPQEIGNLLTTAERDLADSRVEQVSLDGRFASAYNAALSLATIPLYCAGYRTARHHHLTTFDVLPVVMERQMQELADYFQTCRAKRHRVQYDRAGEVSERDVHELIESIESFTEQVKEWLRTNHPELSGE